MMGPSNKKRREEKRREGGGIASGPVGFVVLGISI